MHQSECVCGKDFRCQPFIFLFCRFDIFEGVGFFYEREDDIRLASCVNLACEVRVGFRLCRRGDDACNDVFAVTWFFI